MSSSQLLTELNLAQLPGKVKCPPGKSGTRSFFAVGTLRPIPTHGTGYIGDNRKERQKGEKTGEGNQILACKEVKQKKETGFWVVSLVLIMLGVILQIGMESRFTVCTIRDGRKMTVHTTMADDPEEILREAGIRLEGKDTYLAAKGFRKQEIRISRASKPEEPVRQEQEYTVALPYETRQYRDPALPAGVEKILREGRDGEILVRAAVTYVNGSERERIVQSQSVRRQPVDAIVAVGTGEHPKKEETSMPVIENGRITLPTGEVLTYSSVITSLATAYCDKGLTATGTQARVGAIAVDPDVIPYGTRMFIVSKDGEYIYGLATAEDCGSPNHIYDTRIDLHFDTYRECRAFGARYCRVYFLS